MELEQFTLGSLRRAVFEGDVKNGSLMAGQVSGMLREIRLCGPSWRSCVAAAAPTCGNWNRRFSHESGFSVCGTGHPAPGDGAGSL